MVGCLAGRGFAKEQPGSLNCVTLVTIVNLSGIPCFSSMKPIISALKIFCYLNPFSLLGPWTSLNAQNVSVNQLH